MRGLADLAVLAAPGLFVVLWASGFIGAKFGLPYAEPLTLLSLRMIAVVVLLAMLVTAARPPWPHGARIAHNAVAGVLVHVLYLGGVFVALDHGLPAGICALVVALQPLLTATVAQRVLGERVAAHQWAGFVLGLGGVYLVLHRTEIGPAPAPAWGASAIALAGITAGTLYQKRFGGDDDWRTAFIIQYAAAGAIFAAGAFLFESRRVEWTWSLALALAWLVLVMSFGAVWLLYFLIARSAAARVVSLFYLTPPFTALMAWSLFGERLAPLALAGMAVCGAGVFLVNRRQGGAS
jgi:drug/metabolite transporter (DMT)-like permease